jgi:ATP-dependent RNA helicase DDX49/DBP8
MSELFGKKLKRKLASEKKIEDPASTLNENVVPLDTECIQNFSELGLAVWVQKACDAMGFRRPTPVQRNCIPDILTGKDIIACALTGSGKVKNNNLTVCLFYVH